jgi:GAF domain-containing protein
VSSTAAEELAETFVELADTLVDEFDPEDFLDLLAGRCVRLLDVAAAGLLLVDRSGRAHATGASDERTARLCRLDEGPALDCCRSGVPVRALHLSSTAGPWQRFAAAAAAVGFASAHVVPLRARGEVLGALALYRSTPGELDEVRSRVAQALADLAAIGLTQARSVRRQAELAAQLQHALTSRVVIEQAKGIVSERFQVPVDSAFDALRRCARATNTRIAELCGAVVTGQFDTARLPLP